MKKHPKVTPEAYRALMRKENYTHGGNKIGARKQAGVLGRLFLAQKAAEGSDLHRMRTHLMPLIIDRRKACGVKTGERALSLKMRKYCEKCFTTWGSADSFIAAVKERCPGPKSGGVGAVAQDATRQHSIRRILQVKRDISSADCKIVLPRSTAHCVQICDEAVGILRNSLRTNGA